MLSQEVELAKKKQNSEGSKGRIDTEAGEVSNTNQSPKNKTQSNSKVED